MVVERPLNRWVPSSPVLARKFRAVAVLERPFSRILWILKSGLRQEPRKLEERRACTVETGFSIRDLKAIQEFAHQKGIPSRYFGIVKAVDKAVGAKRSASTSATMCIADRCLKILPE